MKVALAIWNNRISPVFDSAHQIAIFTIQDGTAHPSGEALLEETLPQKKIARLLNLEIETLICGAISRPLACLIELSGIHLISFIAGPADEVLTAYLSDSLEKKKYQMPGCWNAENCPRHQRQCHCPHCRKKRKQKNEDMYSC